MRLIKHQLSIGVIFLAIVSLAIFIVINLSLFAYAFAISYFRLDYQADLSSTSLMKCYFFIVRYLEVPWDAHLHLEFFRASVKGLHHFRDVRRLVLINNFGMALFNLMGLKRINNLSVHDELWRLINPFKVIFSGLLILLSIALIDFQQFFINFHRIMFRNRDWVFNIKTDPVIKVLPMPFFGWCFIGFTLLTLGMLWLLIIYSVRETRIK